jgi:glycerophosphoryl diester phosphodiesterase
MDTSRRLTVLVLAFWVAATALAFGGCPAASDDDDSAGDDDGLHAGDDAGDDDDSADDTGDDDTGCDPLFPNVLIASHRGASMRAPEDTIPAFETAFDLGVDIVEMDIQVTLDGAYVIMHDDTVDRTTDGTGRVGDLTLAQIKALHVDDSSYGNVHGDVRVPTFAEALAVVRERGGQAYLDMKTDAVEGAIAVVVGEEMEAACFVYSSNPEKLARVRAASPNVRIQPSTGSVEETQALIDFFDPDPEHIELAAGGFTPENIALIDTTGATISMDALGPRDILAALGFKKVWFQMMDAGVDIVQTDLPGLLVPYHDGLCE